MAEQTEKKPQTPPSARDDKEKRLAEALRANLRRRKETGQDKDRAG
jgi:hypothetical protein